MSDLQTFKDDLTTNIYGMTTMDAITRKICINCKKPITLESFYSDAGRKEYTISGLREYCFDKICEEN